MSAPNIKKVPTSPYKDPHPGTSGLRDKTRGFMDNPGYTENFIQSVFNTLREKPALICQNKANEMFSDMRKRLPKLKGMKLSGDEITRADEFRYVDPVTKDVSEHQGLRFFLADGSGIITRLSGTGTKGATLCIYLEQFDAEKIDRDTATMLKGRCIRIPRVHQGKYMN